MDNVKHLRISAQQCNFSTKEQTLAHPDAMSEIGFNYEQLFHTHAELYSAVFDSRKHRELLEKYLEKCRVNDIKAILYMNCHILLPSQRDKYEEWAVIGANGSRTMLYETYASGCLNSPWVNNFLEALYQLKGLNISGIFFDGPVYLPCHCPHCQDKFQKRYGIKMGEAKKELLESFMRDTVLGCKDLFYAKVKELNPEWLCYYNEGLFHGRLDSEESKRMLKHNDIIGTEGGFFFGGSPRDVPFTKFSSSAKIAVSVANGEKPPVIFMAGDHKPWAWLLHTPAETRLCYAAILANGASVWYGLHCSPDTLTGETRAAVREMVQFDKRNNHIFEGSRSCAEIALYHSFDTARYYNSSAGFSDFYGGPDLTDKSYIGNYRDSFDGAVAMLTHLNLPFEIVTELNIGRLSEYKVCIAPTAAFVPEFVADKFKIFVEGGGMLIADSEIARYDRANGKMEKCRLEDLFGVEFTGTSKRYSHYNYFCLEGGYAIPERITRFPMVSVQLEFNPVDAMVMGRACPPLAGCYAGKPQDPFSPFIALKQSGGGNAYYIGGNFFEFYKKFTHPSYRWLLESLLYRHYQPEFSLVGATESVEFSVRRLGEATVFALVNFNSAVRPIEHVPSIHGMKIKSRRCFKIVKSLTTGEILQLDPDGTILLSPVREYEFIIAENIEETVE